MKTYDDFYAEIVNPILDGEINVIRVEKGSYILSLGNNIIGLDFNGDEDHVWLDWTNRHRGVGIKITSQDREECIHMIDAVTSWSHEEIYVKKLERIFGE
ncbi:hypothetical protein Ab1vBOLIVR5_gp50c [Agrobacterium phage OLIVR5]|uniref:Uncharacterized protein n=1 Tax=Agrobacterium phage OLIVR5 TaxID=2723773 RepID=A0A858MSY0_9CAUD|nr:hypothetical protein KNU99_gp050 [Agrobacterium phage OLIVR5]QIW87698.1 hypothetical protein Ab1vBOLIVR5_gp50c [Agrobacterium phage OLIVR5]QIW87960.1 hypothetical protein Ab1vBOLIVR6_gp53c [Agrobacterium phage OLIVR6]